MNGSSVFPARAGINRKGPKRIEWVEQCQKCGGTGLYIGMAERDGAAVVCHTCEGTGRVERMHEYEEFTGLKHREGVVHVFATNSGFGVSPKMAGGATYQEWLDNPEVVNESGREMRTHTCPAWWCQSNSMYGVKPNWPECPPAGTMFSNCHYFPVKDECWRRFDEERLDRQDQEG